MAEAQPGDTVKVHYTGKLEDGSPFDSSVGKEPLQFALGWGEVLPGFDKAVTGMKPGESKTVTIPVADGYGPRDEGMVGLVERADFPPDLALTPGLMLMVEHPDVVSRIITILEVRESTVLIDGNHPLAGRDLTFDIELIEIV